MSKQIGEIYFFGAWPPPSGSIAAGGQAISRTKYADLYRVYGTTYGDGDGSTTFNVPNAHHRALFGYAPAGDATPRLTLATSGGIDGSAVGNTGGAEAHTLSIQELPEHDHPTSITTGIAVNGGTNSNQGTDDASTDAVTPGTGPTGGGLSHNNLPPGIVIPVLIYTGVHD